jgi:hypothetical protein
LEQTWIKSFESKQKTWIIDNGTDGLEERLDLTFRQQNKTGGQRGIVFADYAEDRLDNLLIYYKQRVRWRDRDIYNNVDSKEAGGKVRLGE